MERFAKQEGGCCGIHSVAACTGLPFGTALELSRSILGRRKSWKGSSYDYERDKVLGVLGFTVQDVTHLFKGDTLLEASWPGRLDPNEFYMADVWQHTVTLHGGRIIDQTEDREAYKHWCRNCVIKRITLVRGDRAGGHSAADELI